MKKFLTLLCVICLCIVVWAAASSPRIPGWHESEWLTASQSRHIQKELKTLSRLLETAPHDRDALEEILIGAGYATQDSDPVYPAYLANPEVAQRFAAEDTDSFSLLQVSEEVELHHLFFTRGEPDILALSILSLDTNQVIYQEILPLYEAMLLEEGFFSYRCYPLKDPHYLDYTLLRLSPPNREYWDLTRKYILPVGYQMVNLFLTDWTEGSWEGLCINDAFEYLYALETGEEFPWQALSPRQDTGWYAIDAHLFEETMLPYFALTRETLRSLCRYAEETDSYPWRPVEGNDILSLDHALRQPEVVSCSQNPDNTLTLQVRVGHPDRNTLNRFTHEVTVRPRADGGFQYVANRVTYVSEYGLPPTMSRFELDN